MRVLFKYISKLFFGPFLIGLGGFIVFVSVELLYQLSNVIVRNRVGIEKLFVLIYYHLPSFTADGIPVGVLLAIFWTVSTLSQRRELMAMQVHGISLKNLFFPFLVISLALSGVVYLLNDFVVPDYYVKAERYMSEAIFKRPKVEKYIVSESVIRYKDMFIYVREYDRKREIMKGVMIIDYSGSEERVMTAEKVYREGNSWYLVNGRLYIVGEDGKMRLDSVYKKLKLDFEEDIGMLLAYPSERKMSHDELVRAINATRDRKRAAKWIVELHRRYATAFAPVIIVLAGLSLSLLFNLTSKSWGVILTFVLVVLYQGSGAWLSAMGREMMIDPVLSVWLPDILFGGIGLVLLLLVDTTAVQRIREILIRIGLVVIILIPFSGFSYTVVSDRMTIQASTVIMEGNVEVYDGGELVAKAERAIYSIDRGYLLLKGATSIGEKSTLKSSEMFRFEDMDFAEDISGVIDLESGTLTIITGKIGVRVGNVRLIKDSEMKVEKEEISSKVDAVFVVIVNDEVKDGMGMSNGEFKEKRFRVKITRMLSEDEYSGISGFMDTKMGKKTKRFYFVGNKLLVLEDEIEMVGAYLTTCDKNPPHYTISFEKAFVERDYLASRNVVFFLGDVPVFYFPYFFQFFKDPPPLLLDLGVGRKEAKTNFKFSAVGENFGMSYSSSDGSEEFSISGSLMSYPFSISWKGGETGISIKKLPFGSSFSLSSSPGYVVYQYSMSTKFMKSRLKFLVKRLFRWGKTSWIIPNFLLSGLKIDLFGGKFYLKTLSIRGDLSYDEGSIIDHFDETVFSGKYTLSYSRSVLKSVGTSFSFSSNGTFKATPTDFEDYKINTKIALSAFNRKISLGWIEASGKQVYSFSRVLEKDEKPLDTFEEDGNYSLNVKIPLLNLGVGYIRGAEYTEEGVQDLKNKLTVSGTLGGKILSLSGKSEYDFLSDEPKWSYPELVAKLAFVLFGISNSMTAKTKWEYDMEEPVMEMDIMNIPVEIKIRDISITYVQSYGKVFKNTVSFTYNLTEDVPVRLITDKFSLKAFNIWGIPIPAVSGMFKYEFSEDESKITYFYSKLSRTIGGYKNSASFKYTSNLGDEGFSSSLSYSISSSKTDPTVKFSLELSMDEEKLQSFKISLDLKKNLHCWDMNLSLSGRINDGEFSFDRLFIGFVIRDLPEKKFDYNLLTGDFEFSAM